MSALKTPMLPSLPDGASRDEGCRLIELVLASRCGPSPKVIAIPANAIFEREEPTNAALDDTSLRKVVDGLWRHTKASS
jgi:hypothetical protein